MNDLAIFGAHPVPRLSRGSSEAERASHDRGVVGSNPAPATTAGTRPWQRPRQEISTALMAQSTRSNLLSTLSTIAMIRARMINIDANLFQSSRLERRT